MKTFSQKTAEIKREWYVIDAASLPLGKLAVVIADKLMGKSKVTYTPHIDNGDYVIVLNAKNIQVTGNKMVEKCTTVTVASQVVSPSSNSKKSSRRTQLTPSKKLSKACFQRTSSLTIV